MNVYEGWSAPGGLTPREYLRTVDSDIAIGNMMALPSHAVSLLQQLQLNSDPDIMSTIVGIYTRMSRVEFTAVARIWSELVDYLLGWYMDIKTPQSTVQSIEQGFQMMQDQWKFNVNQTVMLLVQLSDDMRSLIAQKTRDKDDPRLSLVREAAARTRFGQDTLLIVRRQWTDSTEKGPEVLQLIRFTSLFTLILPAVKDVLHVDGFKKLAPHLTSAMRMCIRQFPVQTSLVEAVNECINQLAIIVCELEAQEFAIPLLTDFIQDQLMSHPVSTTTSCGFLSPVIEAVVLHECQKFYTGHWRGDGYKPPPINVAKQLCRILSASEYYVSHHTSCSPDPDPLTVLLEDTHHLITKYTQAGDSNLLVHSLLHRISELVRGRQRLQQRVCDFLLRVLQVQLRQGSSLYLDILHQHRKWVPLLPVLAAEGLKLVAALTAAPHSTCYTYVSHAVEAIHIVAAIHSALSTNGRYDSKVKVTLLAWVERSCLEASPSRGSVPPCPWRVDEDWPQYAELVCDPLPAVRHAAIRAVRAVFELCGEAEFEGICDEFLDYMWERLSDTNPDVSREALLAFTKQCSVISQRHLPARDVTAQTLDRLPSTALKAFQWRGRMQYFACQFGELITAMRSPTAVDVTAVITACAKEILMVARQRDHLITNHKHDLLGLVISFAARYCVAEKLKTPLGGPQTTFSELEKMLKAVGAMSLILDDSCFVTLWNKGKEVLASAGNTGGGSPSVVATDMQLLSQRQMLLLLITEVERWVYIAQEGHGLETAERRHLFSTSSCAFFGTNKKVCDDYFSRIRVHLVAAGEALPSSQLESVFFRNCSIRLQEMRGYIVHQEKKGGLSPDTRAKLFYDMEKVVLSVCSVCATNGKYSDVILGYQTWTQQLIEQALFPSSSPPSEVTKSVERYGVAIMRSCLLGMACQAAGKSQEALHHYKSVLTMPLMRHSQLSTLRLVSQHFAECCISCWDWDQLIALAHDLQKALKEMDSGDTPSERKKDFLVENVIDVLLGNGSSCATTAAITMEYAKALSEWETGDKNVSLSLISKTDDKVESLLQYFSRSNSPSSASSSSSPSFTNTLLVPPPLLISRIRIFHALCLGACSGDATPLLSRLEEAARRLQSSMSWRASPESLSLSHLLCKLINKPSSTATMRLVEHALLLGPDVARAHLIPDDPKAGGVALSEVLLCAVRQARQTGNSVLAEKILEKFQTVSNKLSDPSALHTHYTYELVLNKMATGNIVEATRGLWGLSQVGLRDVAFKSILKLQELARSEKSEVASALTTCLNVDRSQVKVAVMERLTTHFRDKKETWCRYAEWCVRDGLLHSEEMWNQAVSAHLTALSLGTTGECEGVLVDMHLALRVLKLLVQGVQAGFVIDAARAADIINAPVGAWKQISPQLLAYLNNPSPDIHEVVKQLLQRLGKDNPLLLLYPLVAGLGTAKGAALGTFEQLWNAMLDGPSVAVYHHTKEFVGELVRVTELIDEETIQGVTAATHSLDKVLTSYKSFIRLKLGTLPKPGCERRTGSLDRTAQKFDLLKRQKFEALLRPISQAMEGLIKKVSGQPKCHHDCEFQLDFLPRLQRALQLLQTVDLAKDNMSVDEAVESTHARLKAAFSALLQSLTEGDRRGQFLSLSDISPQLAQDLSGGIPMPGCTNGVTITRLEQVVELVQSKTRPKKLQFWGSDGRKYTFLLKGKEDLTLDERMMQILCVVSTLLASSEVARAHGLRARSYAVVPLSQQSGLIRFVENVHPIFHLHRQWIRRKAIKDQLQSSQRGDSQKSPPPSASFRPVNHFFSKLVPALKEAGIANIGPRSEWPTQVLIKVFRELAAEAPRELLAKELWCRASLVTAEPSSHPREVGIPGWFDRVHRFACSLAMMSMVGYIIGLGDRHLDNILCDFDTGEIVHIDYNICFEKGLQLRVPEVVPFRMTPILQNALGVQGIEGPFRLACERTLTVLRSHKDLILHLLEAFVHDPLVEWVAKSTCDPASEVTEVKVSLSVLGTCLHELFPDFSDVLHRSESVLRPLAVAVAECHSARHTEASVQIRELKYREASCVQVVAQLEGELRKLRAEHVTEGMLESTMRDFDTTLEECSKELDVYRDVQKGCDAVMQLTNDDTELALPSDPQGVSANNLDHPRRVSLLVVEADVSDSIKAAAARVEHSEMKVLTVLTSFRSQSIQLIDVAKRWVATVRTLIELNSGLQYSQHNFCFFWHRVYSVICEALSDFRSFATTAPDYPSFMQSATTKKESLQQVLMEIGKERQYSTTVAPVYLDNISPMHAREQATQMLAVIEPLSSEVAAIEGWQGTVLRRSCELGEMDTKLGVEISSSLSAKSVVAHASSRILAAVISVLLREGDTRLLLHSWDRSVTLPELEENESPVFLLHSDWLFFSTFRRHALGTKKIVDMLLAFLDAPKALDKARTKSHHLVQAVEAIESFVLRFMELSASMGLLLVSRDQEMRDSVEAFLSGDAALITSNTVEAVGALFSSFAAQIVKGCVPFRPSKEVKEYVELEASEALRLVMDEGLRVTEAEPSVIMQHILLKRQLVIVRSFVNTLLEVLLAVNLLSTTQDLLDAVTRECLGCTVSVNRQQPGEIINKVDEMFGVLAAERFGADAEALGRSVLSVQEIAQAQADLAAELSMERHASSIQRLVVDSPYFPQLKTELKRKLMNLNWLYDPVLDPAVMPPNQPQSTVRRCQLVDTLERHYTLHKTCLADLREALESLHEQEGELLGSLQGHHLQHDVLAAVQERRSDFLRFLGQHDWLSSRVQKIIYLEVLRSVSPQNEAIHARIEKSCTRAVEVFDTLVSQLIAVKHRPQRERDLSDNLQQLQETQVSISHSIRHLRSELVDLQKKASQRTSGSYSEVAEVKVKYQNQIGVIISLLQGLVKTLSQFPVLRRLYHRVTGALDSLVECQGKFMQWCLVFERLWGSAETSEGDDTPIEGDIFNKERVSEAVDELSGLQKDALQQLKELAAIGESIAQGDGMELDEEKEGIVDEEPLEERNMHAVNIIRRVELKLEGRDNGKLRSRIPSTSHRQPTMSPAEGQPEPIETTVIPHPLSVEEQVHKVICEATSLDNLILMYEGWTSWI